MKQILIILGLGVFISTATFAATAGTVNGMKITVKEANKALYALTKGKMTWKKLPKKGKVELINMMAPSKLVSAAARKKLSRKEQDAAISGFWMQKKMSKIKISDSEAKSAYGKMKQVAKKMKSKKKLPAFSKAKNNIKVQLAQEKVVNALMKRAKIKIK